MPPVGTNARRIYGPWIDGFTLDRHSVGLYSRWNPHRTELGELIHRLKYENDAGALAPIVDTIENFIRNRWEELPPVDCLVPAPPSVMRLGIQPATEIARALAVRLGAQFTEDAVSRLRAASPVKRIPFGSSRRQALRDAIQKGPGDVRNKCVLVIDDFTQTLSTLGRVTDVLIEEGDASEVYALGLVSTR
jgi:predicted amidophosphoribosyltransferase